MYVQFYKTSLTAEQEEVEQVQAQSILVNPFARRIATFAGLLSKSSDHTELTELGLSPHFCILNVATHSDMLGLKTALALHDVPVGLTINIADATACKALEVSLVDFYTAKMMSSDAQRLNDTFAKTSSYDGKLHAAISSLNWPAVQTVVETLDKAIQTSVDDLNSSIIALTV